MTYTLTYHIALLAWTFGGLCLAWGRDWHPQRPSHLLAMIAAGPGVWAALLLFAWRLWRTRR